MLKSLLVVISIFLFKLSIAQPPAGYYNNANGLNGYALKTALSGIITSGHVAKSYNSLFTGYQTTDTDLFYDNDGSVLDMYSEIPLGVDSFFYTHNNRTCGNYNSENDCYNREHLLPQSIFNSTLPMQSDIHFVVPSDGYVNGQRSSLPFGEVANPSWTSVNGSKKGGNTFSAFYGGTVFEPIDEFKGDIARCLLYFATRYESNVASWNYSNVFNGTSNQVYTDWFINLLLSWHENDPVNAREISRNNACYTYQGNRNPYIDSSHYVELIWGESETTIPTTPLNLTVSNVSTDSAVLNWSSSFDSSGIKEYTVYTNSGFSLVSTSDTSIIMSGLLPATTYSYYVKATDSIGNLSLSSNTVAFITDTSFVSISENIFSDLKVFPNPSIDGLITISNLFNIDAINIYSIVGETVKLFRKNNTSTISLNLSGAPKGVYFLKLKSNGVEITKRIILN